eukprot:scaffold1111_cov253-Pinguiococcus_pyrenoidosus.AAC.5
MFRRSLLKSVMSHAQRPAPVLRRALLCSAPKLHFDPRQWRSPGVVPARRRAAHHTAPRGPLPCHTKPRHVAARSSGSQKRIAWAIETHRRLESCTLAPRRIDPARSVSGRESGV